MRTHALYAMEHVDGKTEEEFLNTRVLQHAVLRCVTVIGEAATRVSPEVRAQLPGIAWSKIVGLRNMVVHQYDRVMHDRIWNIVKTDLPPLIDTLTRYLESIP